MNKLNFNKSHGFTLVETMIALVITMSILSMLTTIYLTAQQNQHMQTALSFLQENARMVTLFLNAQLHRAGHIGCAQLTADFPIKNWEKYNITPANKISFTRNILTVRYQSLERTTLLQTMKNASRLNVTDATQFKPGDILIISDCKNAEIFAVKNILSKPGQQKITTTTPLSHLYEQHAEIGFLIINSFFIAKTDYPSGYGRDVYALFVKDIKGHNKELFAEVNDMKVNFDFIENGVMVERSAEQVSKETIIKGVSIKLVFTTDDQNLIKTNYIYVGLVANHP